MERSTQNDKMSRRDLIMKGAVVAAGAAAAALTPQVAAASDGEAVTVGQLKYSTSSAATQIATGNTPDNLPLVRIVDQSWGDGVPRALMARTNTGRAVDAWAQNGTAVKAEAVSGTAVDVRGKVRMNRSGFGYISAGKSYVDMAPTGGVTSSSKILVTLQGSAGTGVYLRFAKIISTSKFRVYLNKAATVKVKFAWMVLE